MADPKQQTKEELVRNAQLVRLFEASCKIEHPNPDEQKFRRSLMIKLGIAYGLRGLRDRYEFTDPDARSSTTTKR